MNSLFSQLDIRPSDYNIYIETENSQEGIIAHGYTGYVDVLPADTVAYIKGGMVGRTPDSGIDRNALFERGYLTRKSKAGEQDLIKKILKRAYELRTTPSYTMLLSYDCNFRCTYCNQREVQSRGNRYLSPRMTDEVMDSAFRFMEGGRSDFGLTLFGGEPLSRGNQHQVKRYLKWVKRMGKTTGIISNGFDWEYFRDVMDPEVINGIQVTIDGPKSCHDSRRILVGRQGTFDKILANVKIGLERGLNIYCRINIDSGNAPEIHNLIHHFEKLGLTDFPGFSYYAAHIAANGINDGKKQLFGPESMHKSLGCGSGACSSSSSTSCAPEATGQVEKVSEKRKKKIKQKERSYEQKKL